MAISQEMVQEMVLLRTQVDEMRVTLQQASDLATAQQTRINELQAAVDLTPPQVADQLMQQNVRAMQEHREATSKHFEELKELMRRDKPKPTLVDTKGILKPQIFQNDESKFKGFRMKLKTYVQAVFPEAHGAFDWAEDQDKDAPITRAKIQSFFVEGDALDFIEDIWTLDSQLHVVLQALTEGESHELTERAENRSGLDAWRRITHRFDPTTVGRRRNLLDSVLNPGTADLKKLRAFIEDWEKAVRDYEGRKSSTGEIRKIDDDMKTGILQNMPKDEGLRKHLRMNHSRFATYTSMRDEIFGYCEQFGDDKTGKAKDGDAMDVDALGKGKDGGKGKSGKGA